MSEIKVNMDSTAKAIQSNGIKPLKIVHGILNEDFEFNAPQLMWEGGADIATKMIAVIEKRPMKLPWSCQKTTLKVAGESRQAYILQLEKDKLPKGFFATIFMFKNVSFFPGKKKFLKDFHSDCNSDIIMLARCVEKRQTW